MLGDVALGVGEVGGGLAPGAGVRLLGLDIGREGVAAELPHADAFGTPLDGHVAAVGVVVGGAEGVARALNAAAGVAVCLVVAVVAYRVAGHASLHAAHLAAVGRVECHLVADVGLVDRLHDVNLAVVGPVIRVREPERRPRTASVRGVSDVEYEEPRLVLRLGLQPHREAPC